MASKEYRVTGGTFTHGGKSYADGDVVELSKDDHDGLSDDDKGLLDSSVERGGKTNQARSTKAKTQTKARTDVPSAEAPQGEAPISPNFQVKHKPGFVSDAPDPTALEPERQGQRSRSPRTVYDQGRKESVASRNVPGLTDSERTARDEGDREEKGKKSKKGK